MAAWKCKRCGGSNIATMEEGASFARVTLATNDFGEPEIVDYPDGVCHENIEWQTVGYQCRDCWNGALKLSDLVVHGDGP